MKIFFDSKTGNVERFSEKLKSIGFEVEKMNVDTFISEPCVIITYTAPQGRIPDITESFIVNNKRFIMGVAVSGNLNWGRSFCKCADLINDIFNIDVLMKFELSGTERDVILLAEKIKDI